MKKSMLIMALLLFAVSCVDPVKPEPEPEPDPEKKSLSATPLSLSFEAEGGADYFIVTAENVKFEVTPSDGWIEYKRNPTPEAGGGVRIDVTVGEAEDHREGRITLSAEGVDDVVVAVTQEAPDVVVSDTIWDGSHAVLMNLKGPIKTASYHFSYVYEAEDTLFEFDADGYVTSFTHTKFDESVVPIMVAYDVDKRISTIKGAGDEDYTISFEYGDHGQYIPTEEVFYTISEMHVVSNMLWVPRLVRNLAKITLTDSKDPSKNMTLAYAVEGGNGSLQFTDGEGKVTEDYHTLTFENGFVKTLTYDFYGDEAVVTYTINTETGHFITKEQVDGYGELVFDFNNDTINSVKSMDDGWGVYNYSYNTDLDLVEIMDGDTLDTTLSYEYDQNRNWVGMTIDDDSTVERTVTYW